MQHIASFLSGCHVPLIASYLTTSHPNSTIQFFLMFSLSAPHPPKSMPTDFLQTQSAPAVHSQKRRFRASPGDTILCHWKGGVSMELLITMDDCWTGNHAACNRDPHHGNNGCYWLLQSLPTSGEWVSAMLIHI